MAMAILGISIFFFLGHALRALFLKTKIPDLLFLIVIGYILGPVLNILQVADFGKVGPVLSTIALIVILYEGGLDLKTRELLTSSFPALGLSLITYFSIGLLTSGLVLLFTSQPLINAVLLGVGVGSTSSAIVIPLVRHLNISERTKTILSLESALTDVLVIVVFLIVLDSAKSDNFSTSRIVVGLGPNTIKAVLLGLLSGFSWAFLRRKFPDVTDVSFAGEAWALLTYGFIESFGLNGAMGVLALGFILGNMDILPAWAQKLSHPKAVDGNQLALLNQVTFLLRTFFFVYLGMLFQFNNLAALGIGFIVSLFIFATRYLATHIIFRKSKLSLSDAMMVTAMGPRGLACAVLAMLPVQQGLPDGLFIQQTVFAIIPISIIFTSIFVLIIEKPNGRVRFAKFFKGYPEKLSQPAVTSIPSSTEAPKAAPVEPKPPTPPTEPPVDSKP